MPITTFYRAILEDPRATRARSQTRPAEMGLAGARFGLLVGFLLGGVACGDDASGPLDGGADAASADAQADARARPDARTPNDGSAAADGAQDAAAPTDAGANRAPEAEAASAITINGEPVSITLRGSDPDGDELAFEITEAPTGGALGDVVELSRSMASVEYTPANDAVASDEFRFVVEDGRGGRDEAVVSLSLQARNRIEATGNATEVEVPDAATHARIKANGAGGGPSQSGVAGPGARVETTVDLHGIATLQVIVGLRGDPGELGIGSGGGGGGSFVFAGAIAEDALLVAAGGGGGASDSVRGMTGRIEESGGDGATGIAGGANGTGGEGHENNGGAGGAGLRTDGGNANIAQGGQAIVDGAAGGTTESCGGNGGNGGFGGGGGGGCVGVEGGGGGGGYSGGGAGGGGGGSFVSGTDPVTMAGVEAGDGHVEVDFFVGP
jgi:hypothetical protein